jgi:type VI secretion system VgrG family protein
MSLATDASRVAKAHTPLGPKLFFREMSGREELSRPFEYRLEVWAEEDSGVDPKALLGRTITVEVEIQGGGSRYIDGQCTRFAYIGREAGVGTQVQYFRYEARLRPWIAYMGFQSTSRVFQNLSVPDILRKVFDLYSAFSVEFLLTREYRPWEYCVQFQETDLNFMSRLLEHEGIYYWFRHEMGKHTLVLADDISVHGSLPSYGTIPHMPSDAMATADEEYVDKLQMAQEVQTGYFFTKDYDFKHPSADLRVPAQNEMPYPNGNYEIFDWPGGYWNVHHGEQYARSRLQELQQLQELVTAQSNARGLAPGYLFTLDRCPRYDQNREYLLLAVSTYIRDNPVHSGAHGAPSDWQFTFVAQPSTLPYRPARITPKPRTTGPQTAYVVGLKDNKDEEIVCDEYGRVRVQFHWDREHEYDEESSCWMRIATSWAGNNWGAISLPRVGQEVIVDFLNGDPDYPIIIGSVYNAEHKTPYVLPRWKEYSTWKSRSTKKGGDKDWNEIRFYDYKGKEQVFIHCQWRMDVRVKWNKYLTVKESYHVLVGKSYYRTTGGNAELYTKGTLYQRSDKDTHITSGGGTKIVCEKDYGLTSWGSLEIDAKNHIIIESESEVTLRVGSNFVRVDRMGVTIQGTMVNINSGGMAMPVAEFDADHPGYATECDDGTPGYLDRPHTGGGGWKRGSSKGGNHHAVPPPMPPLVVPMPPIVVPGAPGQPPIYLPQPPQVIPMPQPIPGSLGPYGSQDEAARAGLASANPTSIGDNREYGGLIYKDPATGAYYSTNPRPGTGASFDPSKVTTPPGSTTVGDYHTHGDYSTVGADGNPVRADKSQDGYNSDNFSGTDKRGIASDGAGTPGYAGYLGTPSGGFRKYDPSSGNDAPF